MLTLAKNKPILQIVSLLWNSWLKDFLFQDMHCLIYFIYYISFLQDIDLKGLLYEAYHKGSRDLLYVVPFAAKVLESCAKSKVGICIS